MATITIPTLSISKTTLNGYLTAGMTICAGLLATPQLLPQKYVAIVGGVLALLRILNGHTQQDAGSTPAIIPGSADPVQVPSHEVPDSPSAIPVTKEGGIVPTQTFPEK